MIHLVLCGGTGSRLWPLSRQFYPKQFCKIIGEQSLFQRNLLRNQRLCDSHMILTNQDHYFLALDQIEDLDLAKCSFLLEPVGRNTAPAIALACFSIEKEDEIVLVTPSDHLIQNRENYEKAVQEAREIAEEGSIVTFGIKPRYPEVGYGYIEAWGKEVLSFKEKPDLETAKEYLKRGGYYWNSGMFCFSKKIFLEELNKWAPEIYEACQKVRTKKTDEGVIRFNREEMKALPFESIDRALMEKSDRVKVLAVEMGWSDLGSFEAFQEQMEKDNQGNGLGKEVWSKGCKNTYIISSDRKIAAIDLEDLIVVDTEDALLVSKKGSSHKIMELVGELKNQNSPLHQVHPTVFRPWGSYRVIFESSLFKVKIITVKPGKRLSLQKHKHRSEHWTVVEGQALVTLGEEEILLERNERAHIPQGEIHRLENKGKKEMSLVEVQLGDYLGEDDIIRLEDDFKRHLDEV